MKSVFDDIFSPLSDVMGPSRRGSLRSMSSPQVFSISQKGQDQDGKESVPEQSDASKENRRNTIDVPVSCNSSSSLVDSLKGEETERRQTVDAVVVDSILDACSNHYTKPSDNNKVYSGSCHDISSDIHRSGKRVYSARFLFCAKILLLSLAFFHSFFFPVH